MNSFQHASVHLIQIAQWTNQGSDTAKLTESTLQVWLNFLW